MIRPKEETLKLYRQALEVDFLSNEEVEWYFMSLMKAHYWGKKIDEENREYKRKHRLINRY